MTEPALPDDSVGAYLGLTGDFREEAGEIDGPDVSTVDVRSHDSDEVVRRFAVDWPPFARPDGSEHGITAVALVLRGPLLLMVHRIEDDCWAAPGGKQDYGEPIAYTAVRETHEETGLVIGAGPVVGVTEWFNGERRKHYTMWWIGCRYIDDEQQPDAAVMEPTKHDAVKWVHLDVLPTLRLTEAMQQFVDTYPNWVDKVPTLTGGSVEDSKDALRRRRVHAAISAAFEADGDIDDVTDAALRSLGMA